MAYAYAKPTLEHLNDLTLTLDIYEYALLLM